MEKEEIKAYYYDESEQSDQSDNNETLEKWVCEMNYYECNLRGYCNGDC